MNKLQKALRGDMTDEQWEKYKADGLTTLFLFAVFCVIAAVKIGMG